MPTTEEALLKDLGCLLYQQHKWIPLPSYPLFSSTLPPPPSPSPSPCPSPSPSESENSNPLPTLEVESESSETIQKRKERVAKNYSRASEYFVRAQTLDPKEWLYPPHLSLLPIIFDSKHIPFYVGQN